MRNDSNAMFVTSRESAQTTHNMNVASAANASRCSLPIEHGIPLIAVNAIVCVFVSLGNLLICLTIATNARLPLAFNYLLFSLAIAELIVSLVCLSLLMEIISQTTFFHERTASLECTFSILSHDSFTTSVLHMVAVSFDRFVAVVFPLFSSFQCGLQAMLTVSW